MDFDFLDNLEIIISLSNLMDINNLLKQSHLNFIYKKIEWKNV